MEDPATATAPPEEVFIEDTAPTLVPAPEKLFYIVKHPISPKIMYKLLKLVCSDQFHIGSVWYYIINYQAYKKMLFKNYHKIFLYNLKSYYKKSSLFLFDREFTYLQFILFLNHICASNKIPFIRTGIVSSLGQIHTTYRIPHETKAPVLLKCV
jgi:hypothetical protein